MATFRPKRRDPRDRRQRNALTLDPSKVSASLGNILQAKGAARSFADNATPSTFRHLVEVLARLSSPSQPS
jgi:hypothetical protein